MRMPLLDSPSAQKNVWVAAWQPTGMNAPFLLPLYVVSAADGSGGKGNDRVKGRSRVSMVENG